MTETAVEEKKTGKGRTDVGRLLEGDALQDPKNLFVLRREAHIGKQGHEVVDAFLSGCGDLSRLRDPDTAYKAAACLWALDRYETACDVLSGKEKEPASWYLEGLCRIDRGEKEEARKALEKAGWITGEYPEVVFTSIERLVEEGELEEAEKALKKTESKHGETADHHLLRGRILDVRRDHERALELYERGVELDPDHPKALFHLALLYDRVGMDDEAVSTYERLKDRVPSYVSALLNLGVLYEDRGEFDKSVECYKLVLRADPNNERAILFLKDALASEDMYYDEEIKKEAEKRKQLLKMPLSEFELSVRSRKCLERKDMDTLGELVACTEEELMEIKNFGETSLQEIRDLLAQRGLSLGQKVEEKGPSWFDIVYGETASASEELLKKPVSELNLSLRTSRALAKIKCYTIGDLVEHSEEDLLGVKSFGRTSLAEIEQKLAEIGLSLREE